jgi:hypothetical protein
LSTSDSRSNTTYHESTKVNDAYPDVIHALDPSDSTQSSPRSMGISGTPVGVAYCAVVGVDLAEAEWDPRPRGGGSSGAEDDIR